MKYQILKKYFGYDSFRHGQELLIDSILSDRDVLGIMPTGAGKSLCYQIPALMLDGITLVISPLISLMKDQVQALNQAGVHAAYINSSLTESQITRALANAADGQYKIIYVAPERLETGEFLRFAAQTPISMLTVDEAHCISQWGQDFRPSYLKIVRFIKALPRRPIISAFTATATEAVREDILCVLGLNNPQVSVTGFDRANLFFGVEKPRNKDHYLLQYISNHEGESGIIYCATRKNVEAVYELLKQNNLPVTRYHAGLGGEERKNNQDDFIYDRLPVMVATNAFGMGIDKSNVRFVLHYNMPQSLENYYQEAGRAGRDGEPGECILLYSGQDVVINRFLLDSKENKEPEGYQDDQSRERDEARLKSITYYCLGTNCLREVILRYFGEGGTGACGRCSNCLSEYEDVDVTEAARAIIGTVLDCRQRYGINVIVGTAAGSNSAKLREYRVTALPSYGVLREMTEARIRQIVNQMLLDGILFLTNDKYTLVKLNAAAGEVREGTRAVILKLPRKALEADQTVRENVRSSDRKIRKSDILTSAGLELFERLRELRSVIAREEGMPPYIIFSDKSLVDMCVKLPDNREAMLRVAGVGEFKYEKYGERFIDFIAECTADRKEKYYFGDQAEAIAAAAGNRDTGGLGRKRSREPKVPFCVSKEMAAQFIYREPCLLSEVVNQLNELRDAEVMKKTSGAAIVRLLTEKQYIYERLYNGIWKKDVTEAGTAAGIAVGTRLSAKGQEYEDLYYDEQAQRLIVEWLG